MTIAEFTMFVVMVCNFHTKVLSREYKEDCLVFWSNCAVSLKDPEKVDRRTLTGCLDKAKHESIHWGKVEN